MNVFLLSLGTRGDIELFVTLGRELARRGHRVVLGASAFYAARVAAAGIEWRQVGGGTRHELVALLRALAQEPDKTRRTLVYYQRWVRPQLADFRARAAALVAGADYFISNMKLVLERGGHVIPGAAVTYDPPLDLADLAKYGAHRHGGRILDVVAMSRPLVDPEGRWGEHFCFTGFWHAPAAALDAARENSSVAPDLAAFVQSGSPPVVVTLGSMLMFDEAKLLRGVATALRLAGQRGVMVGGWASPMAADVDRDILCCVQEAPYDWLFPRAACIVHHGGCGTVAAVLCAGKPSILLPQIACQEQLGRMLLAQGLAAGMFDAQTLAPEELADALRRAVDDEALHVRALTWKAMVDDEPGVSGAADAIEQHWRRLST
jgi:UDP:flavonoid glycosyltransferase YjiC (YdhE family)